jgi:hypothetical protein
MMKPSRTMSLTTESFELSHASRSAKQPLQGTAIATNVAVTAVPLAGVRVKVQPLAVPAAVAQDPVVIAAL